MNQDGLQPPVATTSRRQPPIDPAIVIIFFVILFLLFLLPPPVSHIKPTPFKSFWDYFIVFLFLFAILSGVLAHINDVSSMPNVTVPYHDRKVQVNGDFSSSSSSSNSDNLVRFSNDFGVGTQYPSTVNNHSRWTEGRKENIYRPEPVSCDVRLHPRRREAGKVYYRSIEVVPNVPEQRQSPKRARSPPPPARDPAPPVSVKSRNRRTSRSVKQVRLAETVQVTNQIKGIHEVSHIPPPTPSPSENSNELDREARESKKEMAPTIVSLDDQKKKNRKKRQKSRDMEKTPPPPPSSMFRKMFKKVRKPKGIHTVPATAPPPPPPPPPPRSIFNTLFKSGGKSKRFPPSHIPPPQPHPPLPSLTNNSFSKTVTKSNRSNPSSAALSPQSTVQPPFKRTIPIQPPSPPSLRRRPASTHKPPLPTKASNPHDRDDFLSSASQSPWNPIQPPYQPSEPLRRRPSSTHKPPLPTKASNHHDSDEFLSSSSQSSPVPLPPPPPPFKLPAMTFELRGNYVRQRSVHSSDFSSPDRDDLRSSKIDGGDSFGPSPISSRSPDVNPKADSFISRQKYEWRTQK
ncbi:formin-like protein 20 [Cynara cardunculus var. scolymus]|uniref:formin-like protein 20 n=1 Tax=Cynara cardunculus var. scolymus TaxID=59895 RepID=UPI000D62E554|nr:formin-like protein 20 [Cynara cardunculus var. scolymus]